MPLTASPSLPESQEAKGYKSQGSFQGSIGKTLGPGTEANAGYVHLSKARSPSTAAGRRAPPLRTGKGREAKGLEEEQFCSTNMWRWACSILTLAYRHKTGIRAKDKSRLPWSALSTGSTFRPSEHSSSALPSSTGTAQRLLQTAFGILLPQSLPLDGLSNPLRHLFFASSVSHSFIPLLPKKQVQPSLQHIPAPLA